MPLKGTDIVKRLPDVGKKNCRECGFPTCFAFAMKLASGGATVQKCPHLPEAVRAELEEALAPPIRLVTIGSGSKAVKIGNEEVIYRHEKTFVHPPGLALLIYDTESPAEVDAKVKKLAETQFPWVGLNLRAEMLALRFASGDRGRYEALVKKVSEAADVPLVLISEDTDALFAARDICALKKPLVYPITSDNIEQALPRIKQSPTPVGVRAAGIEALIPLTSQLRNEGIDELVIDSTPGNVLDAIRDQTLIRRAALRQTFRPLGYPTIAFPGVIAKDGLMETIAAAVMVIKFAGVIVLSDFHASTLLPLLVERLNIYTDPRIPMSVEQKVYEVLEPNEQSPVLLTSNWALTYFIVSSETEASKVASWVCVKNADGLGVLTAWAAGKFSGDTVGPFIKKCGIEDKVKHRRLIIPGKVARIKGELEDALPGWEIIVGPREASEIPGFLPALVSRWQKS